MMNFCGVKDGVRGTGALFGNRPFCVAVNVPCSRFLCRPQNATLSWEMSHGIEASVGDLSGLQAETIGCNCAFLHLQVGHLVRC
jgi:hypothetical protein